MVFYFLVTSTFFSRIKVSISPVWFIPGLYQVTSGSHSSIYNSAGSERRAEKATYKGKEYPFWALKHPQISEHQLSPAADIWVGNANGGMGGKYYFFKSNASRYGAGRVHLGWRISVLQVLRSHNHARKRITLYPKTRRRFCSFLSLFYYFPTGRGLFCPSSGLCLNL